MAVKIVFLALLVHCASRSVAQSERGITSLPLTYNATAAIQGDGATCPNDQLRQQIHESIQDLLQNSVVPLLPSDVPQCPCLSGRDFRVAYLNMSDPSQLCPTGWRLITSPRRACGRDSGGASCQSVLYPNNGISYTRVCGRVTAYQYCDTGAFNQVVYNPSISIDSYYVDGVSVTHGSPRQHVWTFASAFGDSTSGHSTCTCTNIANAGMDLQTPPYVGNDYFCDSSYDVYPGGCGQLPSFFDDDPLWAGEGCSGTSTCCEFNNPPWFCKTLPVDQPVDDDIEVRICGDRGIDIDDNPIELIEIYVS